MMHPSRSIALLQYIHGYQLAHGGVSPSLRECAAGIGGASTASVTRLLGRLERQGHIRRLPSRNRAIEVLLPPAIPMIGAEPLYAVRLAADPQQTKES